MDFPGMRTVLAILFLLARLVCAQAQNVEIMYFMDEGAVRSACYYKPAGDGPFPAMIYSAANHHSCESETTPFRVLANFYLKQGIVLVLPGRSPVAKENDKKSSVLHDARLHANHLAATIEGLKTQAFVDPKRIFVSGHQLGAVHTLLLAKETNGVAGYIVFSPAVKMMNDHGNTMAQLAKQPHRSMDQLDQTNCPDRPGGSNRYSGLRNHSIRQCLKEHSQPGHLRRLPKC